MLAVEELEEVERVVDARQTDFFRGVLYDEDDGPVAWHVTDDPERIIELIRTKANFVRHYGNKGRSELGPGLYVSAIPEFWVGRSKAKWRFLKSLTDKQKLQIVERLGQDIERDKERGRLSSSEARLAERALVVAAKTMDIDGLVFLASQPYGSRWWGEDWLKPLGIEPSSPVAVKMKVQGRYAKMRHSYPDLPVMRAIRKSGLDGMFTTASMSTNAEMVIFSGRSLKAIGYETF